ncbi:hypothetical protein [Actinopolyspora erythraea]|uniref:hypothetical protein n=1 Tax=Actinopolyspora erythraea TaxID=414996 RepID=UPI001E40DEED|nr:hypothetical protein [Actinopolyspora erythraea]
MLLLLLVAAGVLVFAVATGAAQWAWLSVLLCAVAAVTLFWARVRDRRRSRTAPRHSAHGTPGVADSASPEDEGEDAEETDDSGVSLSGGDAEDSSRGAAEPDPDTEPAEQRTDAADVLLVCEADTVVFVIDERPRYHLDDCSWVGDRETLPLPVAEARELGFTPCAVCAPDSSVARLARSRVS